MPLSVSVPRCCSFRFLPGITRAVFLSLVPWEARPVSWPAWRQVLFFMVFIYRQNRPYFMKHCEQDATAENSSYRDIFKVMFLMITPVILSTFVYNISATIDQTIFMDVMDL